MELVGSGVWVLFTPVSLCEGWVWLLVFAEVSELVPVELGCESRSELPAPDEVFLPSPAVAPLAVCELFALPDTAVELSVSFSASLSQSSPS